MGSRAGVLRSLRRRGRRRVSLRAWAARLAGRLAAAAVLAAALPAFTVPLSAQGQPMGVCMRNHPAAGEFASGGALAPDAEPREPGFIPPNSLAYAAVQCAQSFAASTMVPIGLNIWGGLAIIITVWTGIQMMFAGGFGIGEVVSLVLLLGFPYAVLHFYNRDVGTPWGNMTFTDMVSGMGQEIARRLVDGVFMTFADTFRDVWAKIWNTQAAAAAAQASAQAEGEAGGGWASSAWSAVTSAADAVLGPIDAAIGFVRNVVDSVRFVLVVLVVLLLLVVPALVAYCSYLWGYMSLLVAIVLGPVLIPWILVPQLQFLAWGWFRTLLGAGVHMMVAGACFAVVAHILTIPLLRFGDLMVQDITRPGLLAALALNTNPGLVVLVESAPLIVVAYLGAFKIGEITSMIMNGGSMPASGIGDRLRSARSIAGMGRSAMALGRAAPGLASTAAGTVGGAVTGGAATAVLAARAVMSQATKK